MTISAALLKKILDAAPHNEDGKPIFLAAAFTGATFEGDARFGEATFKGDAGFGGATFKGDLAPLDLVVEGTLDLDGVQFVSHTRIRTTAAMLVCRRTRFLGGVRLDVDRALVRLDDSDLSLPSLLIGPVLAGGAPAGAAAQPKLLSLQGANVAGLTLGNIDLAVCRFAGSHKPGQAPARG